MGAVSASLGLWIHVVVPGGGVVGNWLVVLGRVVAAAWGGCFGDLRALGGMGFGGVCLKALTRGALCVWYERC